MLTARYLLTYLFTFGVVDDQENPEDLVDIEHELGKLECLLADNSQVHVPRPSPPHGIFPSFQSLHKVHLSLSSFEHDTKFSVCMRCVAGCRVCRAEAGGSSERCTCGHCINCDLPSSTPLCPRCQANQECDCCHRHLPSHYYTNNSNRCNTCTKKLSQTHYRASIGNIVHEASIPTARSTHSFDAFVSTNSDVIAALVDDYQCHYRYVREKKSVDK